MNHGFGLPEKGTEPELNWHVSYSRYLERLQDGLVTCYTPEERLAACRWQAAQERHLSAEEERVWQREMEWQQIKALKR